jgi:hypothetical protein
MKVVRALLLSVLVTPALVVLSATQALACSCIPQQPDKAAIKDAQAVFSGTLDEIEPGVEIGFDVVTWTFAVDTVYKGEVERSQDVTTQTQSAACGLVFEEGKRYVLFAYTDESDRLGTNVCTNTRPLGRNEELNMEPVSAFSESPPPAAAPAEDEVSGWDPIAIGSLAMVVVVGISTLVMIAIRRRRT